MNFQLLDWLLLLMILIWGANFSIVKVALRDFPEIPFNAMRMVVATIVYLVMLRVTSVRMAVLAPVVLVLCVVGAYALNNTMQSVYVLLLFGVAGYVLVKLGFPLAPLILGLILGDQIEINLVRAIMTDANPWLFVTRPISGANSLMNDR